jgi:hypothetical protein
MRLATSPKAHEPTLSERSDFVDTERNATRSCITTTKLPSCFIMRLPEDSIAYYRGDTTSNTMM